MTINAVAGGASTSLPAKRPPANPQHRTLDAAVDFITRGDGVTMLIEPGVGEGNTRTLLMFDAAFLSEWRSCR